MSNVAALLPLLSIMGVADCAQDEPLGLDESPIEVLRPAGANGWMTVMTRNIYVGANVDRVLAAPSPTAIPGLVEESWRELLATNFPERAEAIADEIDRYRPHLIGLQEVSVIRTQSPGDAIVGGTMPAQTVFLDFLQILLAVLEDRRLSYVVAAMVQNTDFEAPRANATFDDVRVTDFDVILARSDVTVSNAVAQQYRARFSVSLRTGEISILRGFVAVNARVAGRTIRFVNTHLEPETAPTVQVAQGSELMEFLRNERLPVIVVGDFNSRPSGIDTPTYRNFLAAGYSDAWEQRSDPHEGGLTCCQASDLQNTHSTLEKRIDYVLVRPRSRRLGLTRATVVGDDARDKTPLGLWPSDHAGVVVVLQVRQLVDQ